MAFSGAIVVIAPHWDSMSKQIPADELDAVLSAAAQFPGGGSIEDITGALAISLPHRTLQRRLAWLVAKKRLIAEGRGRASRYRLPTATAELHAVLPAIKAEGYGETTIPISSEAEVIKRAVREPISAAVRLATTGGFLMAIAPTAPSTFQPKPGNVYLN